MKVLRTVTVAGLAIAAAVLVVRTAAVDAWAQRSPDIAARLWPAHPQVVIRQGLEAIGRDALARRAANPATVSDIVEASRRSPLSPDPFVVRGVDQQSDGEGGPALSSFQAAVRRDPRSIAARYFLADRFVATGNVDGGLQQVAVLSRLIPRTIPTLVPALATFARMSGGGPRVKAALQDNPAIEPFLLDHLAMKAENAALVLALWSGRPHDPSMPDWRSRMVGTLIEAGDVGRAHDVWKRVSGGAANSTSLIFNPTFGTIAAPPPFNWTFLSSGAGSAEPSSGRLGILYYGRENAVLASQILLLTPGRYRLSMITSGGSKNPAVLGWTVQCLGGKAPLARVAIVAGGATGKPSTEFVVPGNCTAQRLELAGTAPEFPDTVNATVEGLTLTRTASS